METRCLQGRLCLAVMCRKWGCLKAVLTTCSVWVSLLISWYSAGGNLGPGRCVPWETEEQDVVSFWRSGLHWFSAHRGQVCSLHQAHRCLWCEASGAHGLCSPLDSVRLMGEARCYECTSQQSCCYLVFFQTIKLYFPSDLFILPRLIDEVPAFLWIYFLQHWISFYSFVDFMRLCSLFQCPPQPLEGFVSFPLLGHSLIQYVF